MKPTGTQRAPAGANHRPATMRAGDWPRLDYTRVPFRLYHDPEVYRLEQERIFKGPTWSYVALEAELPNPGDFLTTYIGETPVIVNRGQDGTLHAMVNQCAHRGALVRREVRGNAKDHVCIYHRWAYDLEGSLTGLPFRRGLKGKGGMSPDFKLEDHGLRKLRVESYAGVVFATFSERTEALPEYLGPVITKHFDRVFARPIRILGYQRQRIRGNWKFYLENQRDTYHGSLLHEFQSTFGTSRVTQTGGVTMDSRHRHNLTWSKYGTDNDAEFSALYKENKIHESKFKLNDPAVVEFKREFVDGISLGICGIFPNATVHQIMNSLAARHLRTFSQDEFELTVTLFGYQDDPEEMTRHRLLQANMVGPAGLISMEDGEAIEITHRATAGDGEGCSVVEMGGGGEITDLDHRINDVPCRGFWAYYAQIMGIEPEGAIR